MRRIALKVDALKEALHEILGEALQASDEPHEREGKLLLNWHLLDEGYPSCLEIDPEIDREICPVLMFRNFLSLEQSAERLLGEVRHSDLCEGINELNNLMEEGHFFYDTHHNAPPTVALVLPIVCDDGTVAESVMRDYLYRALGLGARFVPQLSALARGSISTDEFYQFVHENEELLKEVMQERLRRWLEQIVFDGSRSPKRTAQKQGQS
jgi:hypothetical protein